MSIEERMSKSIVYNLTILHHVIKPTEQLAEVLTEGLFIKTNTHAFIQVTYYLFNILDSKEFRKKFYWPIIDKKTENSYRTCSVEFINSLIDKYSLNQEKIKHVSVVHPSGKKFMSLILDLIIIAIKEVMKRKKYSTEASLDLEKAEEVVNTISEIENDIVSNMKTEIKIVREKTNEIQELINSIYPSEENAVPFEEFIENWHAINKARFDKLKERKSKIKDIFIKANMLQQKGHEMLSNREYEIVHPTSNEIKELAEFYQNIELPIDKQHNIVSLILYLESTLSIIQNYIMNFSYDEVEISQEEMNVVKRKLIELQHFEPLIKKLTEKEEQLKEKITKMKTEKEERELLMDDEIQDEDDKLLSEAMGKEPIKTLISPRHNFETARNSMNSTVSGRNKLVFGETDGNSRTDHSMIALNQSRLYRPLSDSNLNKSREMGPPRPKEVPSRHRRRNPMQLLEQAFSATKSRSDLNSTTLTGAIPKLTTSTPFSSTLRSPDLIHHANFSMISEISTVARTPNSPNQFNKMVAHSLNLQQNAQFHAVPKPDVLSCDTTDQIPWNDENKTKKLQRSPITKADPLVSLEEAFGCRKSLYEIDGNAQSSQIFPVPKIILNDESLCASTSTNVFSTSNENTICEKENFGCELTESDTVLFTKQACEEDLFNVSDSILVND